MTTEEAKLILAVHRGVDDPCDDERLDEALDLVRKDPALREWYLYERRCIAVFDEKLKGVLDPPADLKERILDEFPAAAGKKRSHRTTLYALAAVVVLSLAASYFWTQRPYVSGGRSLAAYQQDMNTYLDRFFVLDYQDEKVSNVKSWLKTRAGVDHFAVPAAFADHPSLGCELITWHDRKTFLICFEVDGDIYHLFLLPGGSDLKSPAGDLAAFPMDAKWAWRTWRSGDDLYYCCVLGKQKDFDAFLEPTGDHWAPTAARGMGGWRRSL